MLIFLIQTLCMGLLKAFRTLFQLDKSAFIKKERSGGD